VVVDPRESLSSGLRWRRLLEALVEVAEVHPLTVAGVVEAH